LHHEATARESILSLVARALPAIVWSVDSRLVFRSSQGAGLNILGRPQNDAKGMSIYQFFDTLSPEHPAIAAHLRALEGKAVAYDLEASGRIYRAFVEPEFDDSGAIDGVHGLALDVTAEFETLASLRRSEEALALAQAAARLGSWTCELATEHVAWSDELYRLCGLAPGAVEPTAGLLRSFVHPGDRLAFDAAIEAAGEDGRPFVVDSRLVRADGTERWVQHRGRTLEHQGRAVRIVGTVLDIDARKHAADDLVFHANHDDLTGLPNRKFFVDRLQQALLQAQQNEGAVAVLYIDLDRFKVIGDTLGYEVGNRFLQAVAPRLVDALGERAIVARCDGDEFLALLSDVENVGDASRAAERIVAAFSVPVAVDERELYSSATVGIALSPEDGQLPEALIRSADAAHHRAKLGGHGTFRFAKPATLARALDRLELERALRRAYERGSFELHYQPIVDRFERPVAVEALLRWTDPTLGSVAPDHFIPLCEETGLIVPLGRWVVRSALAQLAAWRRRGLIDLRLAMNISGRQVVDPGFVAFVVQTITETGVKPERIELEITESVIVGDVPGARGAIAALREHGIRIALDDFGTGYSALSYLKHFNVDGLKIDRSFVRDLPADRGDAAIVSAVVALGHAMGLSVLAEGVESAEQAALVRRLGCDEMQGFHFSKALPADTLERVMRAWSGSPPPP
jgi:diguanylate cyclase (GGDEF)-like protein/PAS domain S-box-containing protein